MKPEISAIGDPKPSSKTQITVINKKIIDMINKLDSLKL